MYSDGPTDISARPLPPIIKEEKLPQPPPTRESVLLPPPPPPPKISADTNFALQPAHDQSDHSSPANSSQAAPSMLDPHAFVPALSPNSLTTSAPPSPSLDGKPKKANHFVDLVETEKVYVDLLSGVIRKVAAAWSRTNLPPPELDIMFRAMEAIYKTNRAFLNKLKDIGADPRPLGDLLMKWIDDLDGPYTSYCSRFMTGFDTWQPVQSNSRLLTVLATFSAANPPPIPASASPHPSEPPLWTLDALFYLPRSRIKYYSKLYGRLLRNNNQRNGDNPLAQSVEKLNNLLAMQEGRATITPGGPSQAEVHQSVDEVVIDTRSPSGVPITFQEVLPGIEDTNQTRGSSGSSHKTSSQSSGERLSMETSATSVGRESSMTLSAPISNLEQRVDGEKCIDLFTMKPRPTRLVMNPPTLAYTRTLRFSADVVIHFTPRTTGEEIIHRNTHIYLLTDLFLICEKISPDERGPEGQDMKLCYPPLAGKHLRIEIADGTDSAVMVTILKKEVMVIHLDSRNMRDFVFREFQACIEMAASLPPPSKTAPPPVPSLNNINRSAPASTPEDPRMVSGPSRIASGSPPAPGGDVSMRRMDPHRQPTGPITTPPRASSMSPPMSGMLLSPEAQMQSVSKRLPAIHDPTSSDGSASMRASSTAESILGPGQAVNHGQPPQSYGAPNGLPQQQASLGGVQPQGHAGTGGPPQRQVSLGGQPQFGPGAAIPPQRAPIPMNDMIGSNIRLPPPNGMNGPFVPPPRGESAWSPPPGQGMTAPNGMLFHQNGSGQMFPPPPPVGFHQARSGSVPPALGLSTHRGPPGQNAGPSSDPSHTLRKSPSARSLGSQDQQYLQHPHIAPPMPAFPGGYPPPNHPGQRADSFISLQAPLARPVLPSAFLGRAVSSAPSSFVELSPPNSPIEEQRPTGPVVSALCATMKCKVFLQQQHAQWKSLGGAKLTLFDQRPTNVKQLVVEAENREKTILISTIVLTDGVERVGKTGVAIELSNNGARTGIVYMLQLRNEKSAGGLFDSLLSGSDRSAMRH